MLTGFARLEHLTKIAPNCAKIENQETSQKSDIVFSEKFAVPSSRVVDTGSRAETTLPVLDSYLSRDST
jgi:hypothetical protein